MNWINKLKEKWKVKSSGQFAMILIVFALTGSTVLLIKKPIVDYFTVDGEKSMMFTIIYLICILPIYNSILLFYGTILGQFNFFWSYEKKMINRFKRKKTKDEKISKDNWFRSCIHSAYLSKNMNKYIFILIGLCEKAGIIEVSLSTPLIWEIIYLDIFHFGVYSYSILFFTELYLFFTMHQLLLMLTSKHYC